jgi:hypothetical protein
MARAMQVKKTNSEDQRQEKDDQEGNDRPKYIGNVQANISDHALLLLHDMDDFLKFFGCHSASITFDRLGKLPK